jgi:hypothetical protein
MEPYGSIGSKLQKTPLSSYSKSLEKNELVRENLVLFVNP